MTALIGLDWGSSGFRAWAMGPQGEVLAEIREGPGALSVPDGDFDAALEAALAPWPCAEAPILASGMVGARNGWIEAPYLPLPLDAAALAGALTPHVSRQGRRIWIVPGAARAPQGAAPDVMRGEETEIVGRLAAEGARDGFFILPGTHSKWARVEGGRLVDFRTCMTGEVFALLMERSILGRLARPGPPDPAAFARGLEAADAPGALLSRIFSARSLALFERLAPEAVADYLSGLLIGDETAAGLREAGGALEATIVGRGDLAARYEAALRRQGVAARIAEQGMARRGLWEIAGRAGVLK